MKTSKEMREDFLGWMSEEVRLRYLEKEADSEFVKECLYRVWNMYTKAKNSNVNCSHLKLTCIDEGLYCDLQLDKPSK
jgi:hypothetical protein